MELHIHIFLPSPAQNKKPSSEAPSKKTNKQTQKTTRKLKKCCMNVGSLIINTFMKRR
jgi:hypothetical protein